MTHNNFEAISKLQKRAIRTITHSHYIAHSEPLLKQLNLLKVNDMIDLKLLKFHNEIHLFKPNFIYTIDNKYCL